MQDTTLPLDLPGQSSHAQGRRFAGRKKKKKLTTMQDKVADAALLLKEQIAKANFVTAHGPSSVLNEERRSSSPASTSGTTSSRSRAPTALNSDSTDATRSEIIENYFRSQSELRSQMERQYLDRLARNEFDEPSPPAPHTPDPPSMSRHGDPFSDVTDASVLKTRPTTPRENGRANPLKRKRTSTKTHPPERETLSPAGLDLPLTRLLPTSTPDELEILAQLPPLDPALIAEYADFVFEPDPEPENDADDPSMDPVPSPSHHPTALETDAYSQESAETARGWAPSLERPHFPPSLPPSLVIGKIDWGSESEEDDEEADEQPEAPCPAAPDTPRPTSCLEARLPEAGSSSPRRTALRAASPGRVLEETAVELRVVAEAEVERLHSEEVLGLNGNVDKWGCWREWQETLTVETYGHEDLLILPYTVIDF